MANRGLGRTNEALTAFGRSIRLASDAGLKTKKPILEKEKAARYSNLGSMTTRWLNIDRGFKFTNLPALNRI